MPRHKQKVTEPPKSHIAREIFLHLLQAGELVLIAAFTPHSERVIHKLAAEQSDWEPYYPASIKRKAEQLRRHGLVDVKKTANGYIVSITDKGKTELLKYDLENISIKKQEPWDHKWRMVFFDIPTGNEIPRKAFRETLKTMGFFRMQKSVYIYPYPCNEQIKFLREVYELPHFIKLATIENLENDEDLRKHFQL